MAYRNGHYICDRCGAVDYKTVSRDWKVCNSAAVCPRCLALEKQTKLIEKQTKILEKQERENKRQRKEEIDEVKRERRQERIRKISNALSSVDEDVWKKIILWVLLWWVLIIYYPIKFLIVGIREGEMKKIILGGAICGFYLIAIIITAVREATAPPKQLEFEGLNDTITVIYGDNFSYNDGISLKIGGNTVKGTITHTGSVDTTEIGQYTIIYKAEYEKYNVTKEVKVNVEYFYSNDIDKVYVYERFNVKKSGYNSYTISGNIDNLSDKVYSKIVIDYYCIKTETTYNVNFDDKLSYGKRSFSFTLESNEYSLDDNSFKINKIKCYL